MARFFKNPDIVKNGKLAARLPIVPSSAYGDTPVDGLIRYNQNSKRIEFYYNGVWSQVAKIGSVQIVAETVGYGDGSNSAFTMSQSETDPTAIAAIWSAMASISRLTRRCMSTSVATELV